VPPTFHALGVRGDIAARLDARGITEALPIQAAAVPDALAGRDICGRAPTGSGKTIAFGIPLVTLVKQGKSRRPTALVLAPTRELAAQIREEINLLGGPKGPRSTAIYGGVGFGNQIKDLRRGVDIVVACPGRLRDLLDRRELVLDDVGIVVIDEADRMADMGFLPEVRRILDLVRADRQTLLFSATLDGDVDVLIKHYQRDAAVHDVAAAEDATPSRHLFWEAEQPNRLDLTKAVVSAQWPAVVFCRTKHRADRLSTALNKLGVSSAPLHGDRSQAQRERALAAFAAGKVQALVATDVAARGIHVDDIACVVHYDIPGDDKSYVHRSGRTGRAGAAGVVVSLVGRDQLKDARTLQRALQLPSGLSEPDVDSLADPGAGATIGSAPAEAARPATSRHQGPKPAPGRQQQRNRYRGRR